MPRFTRLERGPDESSLAAEAWLTARLEDERAARSLPAGIAWDIQRGRRETGPPGGPQLARVGFLVQVVDPSGDASHAFPCFVAEGDIHDEEQRPVAEQVLSLWLDRALG